MTARLARASVLLALAGTLAIAASPGAGRGETVEVGSTLTLPPFEFVERDGRVRGFEIDTLEAIGTRLGLAFEYVKTPFSQAFLGLAAGKYRLNASAIYIRCERIAGAGKVGRFTVPTFDVSLAITARDEHRALTDSLRTLAGRVVGVESRGSGADRLVESAASALGIRRVVFDSTASLFLGLRQGRVDAAVQSELVSRWMAARTPGLVVGPALRETAVPVGFLFREGDLLRETFNDAIDDLKRHGRLAELYRRWFGRAPDSAGSTARVVPEVTLHTCGSARPASQP